MEKMTGNRGCGWGAIHELFWGLGPFFPFVIQTLRAFRRGKFGGLEAWMVGGQEVWRSAGDLEQSGVTQAGLYQR